MQSGENIGIRGGGNWANALEELSACPICNSNVLNPFLECIDYTVSKEKFKIVQCATCGFRFTNPRPEESISVNYYQSEDYVSHSDTQKGVINKLYHIARKFTLARKLKMVKTASNKTRGNILDLGCGTGAFLNVCKENGWNVQGIEPSVVAREFAKNNYGIGLYDIKSWDKIEDHSIDVVTAWHVLEHIYKLEEEILQVKRVLAESGSFIVALPNCNSADAEFYCKYWAAYDVPRHIWHFTPSDVKRFIDKQGFSLKDVLPMPWDAYYICMLSEKYKLGTINYPRAMIHGWYSNKKAKKEKDKWSSQIYILKPIK